MCYYVYLLPIVKWIPQSFAMNVHGINYLLTNYHFTFELNILQRIDVHRLFDTVTTNNILAVIAWCINLLEMTSKIFLTSQIVVLVFLPYLAILSIPQTCWRYPTNIVPIPRVTNVPRQRVTFVCSRIK